EEWLSVEAPGLRIVPEELWAAAHARRAKTRAAYLRPKGGQLWSRPEAGLESKYLLSGFTSCGLCGSSLMVARMVRNKARRWYAYYVCSAHRLRGGGACPNRMMARMGDLDAAVVTKLRT